MNGDELLTLPQIADELQVASATVRWWVSTDRLPAQRAGRKYLVRRSDLDTMLTTTPPRARTTQNLSALPKRFSEISLLNRTQGGNR